MAILFVRGIGSMVAVQSVCNNKLSNLNTMSAV